MIVSFFLTIRELFEGLYMLINDLSIDEAAGLGIRPNTGCFGFPSPREWEATCA